METERAGELFKEPASLELGASSPREPIIIEQATVFPIATWPLISRLA